MGSENSIGVPDVPNKMKRTIRPCFVVSSLRFTGKLSGSPLTLVLGDRLKPYRVYVCFFIETVNQKEERCPISTIRLNVVIIHFTNIRVFVYILRLRCRLK